jgi:hypothetical protein
MSHRLNRFVLGCAALGLSLHLVAACGPESGDADPGTADQRPAGPLTIAVESEAAVSRSVDATGATIRTTAADGTVAELLLPPMALPSETTITVTPVRELEGLPVSGELLAAVHLEPHGLGFLQPVTLRLTIPTSVDPEGVLAYAYDERESRESVAFVPLGDYDAATSTAELSLYHFSGAGIATGDTNDIRSNVAAIGDSFRQEVAIAQREARSRDELVSKLSTIYMAWFEQLLGDPIRALSGEGLESTRDVVEAYASWVGDLIEWQCKLDGCGPNLNFPPCFADSGFDPELDKMRTYAAEKFSTHYTASIEELSRRCDVPSTLCEKKEVFDEVPQWNELIQLGGVTSDSCRGLQPPDAQLSEEKQQLNWASCSAAARELFGYIYFTPSEAIYSPVGDEVFLELLGATAAPQDIDVPQDIDADRDYGKRAWERIEVTWRSSLPDVASVTDVTEHCNLPCGRGIVVTPKAPGTATITATASGDGICDGSLQATVELVVAPDTNPPIITSSGGNTLLVVDTPQTMELRVAANDGRPLHYMYDGLRGGTGITQAVFFRDSGFNTPGPILGVGSCSDSGWGDGSFLCRYSHTFPACFEHPRPGYGGATWGFAWGAIVYDGAGNASQYTPQGTVSFTTSNPPPC